MFPLASCSQTSITHETRFHTHKGREVKFYFLIAVALFVSILYDTLLCMMGSRDSSVGIATRYRLDGPGIESRWGDIFRTYPDRLQGPPSLLYNGYRVFPGSKVGRGVMLITHPLLVPRLRKSWAIPPLTLWVLLGLLRSSLYVWCLKTLLLILFPLCMYTVLSPFWCIYWKHKYLSWSLCWNHKVLCILHVVFPRDGSQLFSCRMKTTWGAVTPLS
jgi:hypothetical protein